MLDYKLVEAFAAVIEEKGFDRAAQRLHITQSAVSQRIRQLEGHCGRILVQRTSPPRPTEAGISLLRHFSQVRHLEEDLLSLPAAQTTGHSTSLALGVNADSLATWFLPAVHPFLERRKVVLDLHVDDQDRTHRLLQEGKVLGCITNQNKPLQGCRRISLGVMEYILCSSPAFSGTWFPAGFCLAAAERAPIIRFNRQDGLNDRLFRLLFGTIPPPGAPTFFVPSSETFVDFIRTGSCYGLVPQLQANRLLATGELIEVAPGFRLDVHLFWHCWNLRSELLEGFTDQLSAGAAKILGIAART